MDISKIRLAMNQEDMVTIKFAGEILEGYILYEFPDGWFIFGLYGKVKDLMVNCGMVLSVVSCLKSA